MIPLGILTQQLFETVILIWDTFTGSDGVALPAHAPDINLAGEVYQTTFSPNTKIYSNKADPRDNTGGAYTSLIDCEHAKIIVEGDFVGSSGTSACGLWLRQNNGNEGFFLGISNAQTNDPQLTMYTYTGSYTVRDSIDLTDEGPMGGVIFHLKMWVDSVGVYGEITIGENVWNVEWISGDYAQNTFIGFRLYDTGGTSATIDNFKVTTDSYRGAGSGSIEYIANESIAASNTGSGPIVINKPIGTAENDLIVLIGNTRNSFMDLPTGGETWIEKAVFGVLVSSVQNPYSSGNELYYIWYKFAGASEPSSYNVGVTDEGTDGQSLIIATFRGATSLEDYDVGTAFAPSIIAQDGDLLLAFHGTAFDVNTESSVTAPSNMILIDKVYIDGPDTGSALAYKSNIFEGETGLSNFGGNWDAYDLTGHILIR